MRRHLVIHEQTRMHAHDTNRKLWTWGNGGSGRLGHGSLEHKLAPTEVEMDSVKIVACGTSHTLVLSSPLGADASVFAFGAGGEGQPRSETVITAAVTLTSVDARKRFVFVDWLPITVRSPGSRSRTARHRPSP